MKHKIIQWINKYLNDRLDLREQIFHQLLLIGMVLGVVVGISCIITNAGIINIAVNFLASALAIAMLEYSSRVRLSKRWYLFSVIVIFIILFPTLFFTAGGYHSGMPSFFVFAVVFTVFILEGKIRNVTVALEAVLYIGICLLAYHYPGTVSFFETERDMALDIVIGFTISSAALGITIFRYTHIYDRKQKELESLNRMKTEFLQDIKHEIKNPLLVISFGVDFACSYIGEKEKTEEVSAALAVVQNEALRVGRMISGMVELATMSGNAMSRDKADLAAMLRICAETSRLPIEKKNNKLHISIADNLPLVYAETEQLERVSMTCRWYTEYDLG